jgi:8-oxo-dGTP diphosphatase
VTRLVVAAVVRRDDGRFLLAQRPPGSHMAGLWEFPGGGVHDGEPAEAALVRELGEELGVGVEVQEPVTFAWHRDEKREILLLFYSARITQGVPVGQEGQAVGWFLPSELPGLATPPADAPLLGLLARSCS